jgi:hypothetical protein
MSASPAPPLPGSSGTFSVATWNIKSIWGAGLVAAAKGLRQIGVGCIVLTKTKLSNDQYPRLVSGYHVIASKAANLQLGRIAVLWKLGHGDFEVEAVHTASPNILTAQLVTGGDQFLL